MQPNTSAPIQNQIVTGEGHLAPIWVQWFFKVSNIVFGQEPSPVPIYGVSGVPSATEYAAHMIYVSDESGGATLAFSDGVNWRRTSDRAIIS